MHKLEIVMKKHWIYIVALMWALGFTSCEEFLDLKPISEETSDNAYTSASQIEAALVGVYESFQASEYYVWDNLVFNEVRSDNYYAGGDNPEIISADLLNITPTNSRLFRNWSNIYNAIAKANTVLEKVDGVTDIKLTSERKAQIKGEAYFLRAFHYFTLVRLWGGVPLVVEATTSADPDLVRVPRASEAEVYEQILADLDKAIELLPDVYGADASVNKARATAGAAYALAAKACAQAPNHDYTRALGYIAQLEQSSANYRLIDYAELFDGNHYNNAESILEIQYLGGDEGSYGPQLLLPPSISGDSWRKFVVPSHNLIDAYDALSDNVRKNASVLFEEVQWVDEYWGNAVGSSVPFAYKWKNAGGWASSDHVYLLRLADLILLKAEALNETNQLSAAVAEVNRIRARVSLANLSNAESADKATLRATILNERRLELAQECHRWDDLTRHGLAVETMNNLHEIDLRSNTPTSYNMTEAKQLLPIPQQELDRNPALVQNPL